MECKVCYCTSIAWSEEPWIEITFDHCMFLFKWKWGLSKMCLYGHYLNSCSLFRVRGHAYMLTQTSSSLIYWQTVLHCQVRYLPWRLRLKLSKYTSDVLNSLPDSPVFFVKDINTFWMKRLLFGRLEVMYNQSSDLWCHMLIWIIAHCTISIAVKVLE